MYVRFVCPRQHPYTDAELGIYRATDWLDFEDQPQWLCREYESAHESMEHISVPRCVSSWSGTADGRRSLCWLRGERDELVSGFRHLAWVMGEMGVPVSEIVMRDPGHIIYRDDAQVVALPGPGLPRAFPRKWTAGV